MITIALLYQYLKCVCVFSQDVINYLRGASHSNTYAASMPAPVAQQIITSMSIIMGEDGTKEGTTHTVLDVHVYTSFVFIAGEKRIAQLLDNSRYAVA